MIWLRLGRLQLTLVLASALLLVGAVAALVVPAPAPLAPSGASGSRGTPPSFEAPLPAVANDPAIPLVEGNPFDASRKPPAQRITSTRQAGSEDGSEQMGIANFVLLGTVITGNGRDIAVIQANGVAPGGTYHVGEEPMPGYRVTRITRTGATLSGPGGSIDLEIQKPGQEGQAANPVRRFGPGAVGPQPTYNEGDVGDEDQ
jgi:hypothetical protein